METFFIIMTLISGQNQYSSTAFIGEFPTEQVCEEFTATVARNLILDPKTPWVNAITDCFHPTSVVNLNEDQGEPT